MRKINRVLLKTVLCLCCAVIVLGLAGCGNSDRYGEMVSHKQNVQEKAGLSFFGNKNDVGSQSVIESSMRAFMEKHKDVNLTYEAMKGNDYFVTLKKRLQFNDADDVFILNHDLFLVLKNEGKLAELQDLPAVQNINPGLLDKDEQGRVYWVPTTVSAFGLYCNEDLLKKHHQKVPQNLKEWREVNDYFLSKGITPVVANNDISLKTMAIGVSLYPYYKDGSIVQLYTELNNGNKKLGAVLTPGFKLVEEFIQKKYIDSSKALVTEKTKDDINQFLKGEAPFMLTGAWATNRVKKQKPAFKFSVQPLPVLEDGSILVINADTRMAVNAKSKNLQLAKEYLDSFCSAENLEKFCLEQASFNPNTKALTRSIDEVKALQDVYSAKRYAVGSDDRLELPIWELTRKAVVEMLKGADAAQAMQKFDDAVSAFENNKEGSK